MNENIIKNNILSYRDALYSTMYNALDSNTQVIIIGQGVDDYKGTFGSTLGLAQKFGHNRVIDTPIAEEGITGVAIGASLNGLYPIQTHIRMDFALVAMNQLVNHAAKYRYMFGGNFKLPMLIRMVIGRSWGQGAQHSQSLQSLFGHIPGLTVIMPATSQSVIECYNYAISEFEGPVITLEHRLLYDIKFNIDDTKKNIIPWSSYIARSGDDVTIVASSIMVLEALRAADYLLDNAGIKCEVIDLNCISHPDKELIIKSVKKTGKLIIADTSWPAYGVCAEICRIVCEHNPNALKAPVISIGMQPSPCPTAKILEDYFYPNLKSMVDNICKLVTGKEIHGIPLPDENSFADVYKRFKGPF